MQKEFEELENSLFTPALDTERKYKEQINILLKSGGSKSDTIDMGRLPYIYSALGITDKELKANGTTILKALGIEGRKDHNVPMETIENLISLTHDPEAVFRSLSKPNIYISVLNAKSENNDQIIAILSPSSDGHGFTFIPSVYDKQNFDNFLEKLHEEKKVLYIKDKGSELWGRRQLSPRHNQEPSTKNILTKIDIVKRFNENILQRNPPPLERRNVNSKETIMSEKFEEPMSPNEMAFRAQVHQRKVIADALKNGTLCCLPGPDGYADTVPAVNLVNGNSYHGANMLFLKDFQKQNGFPTAEYVTSAMVDKAGLSIRQGQKGVTLHISERNEQTGEYENKRIHLFNVAQTTKPWEMKKWVEQSNEEYAQKNIEYLKTQYGSGYEPPEKKQKESVPEITCSSTDPEKYLGQYLAAVSMGSRFKATPEQAAEFSEKMTAVMYKPMTPKINPDTGEVKIPKINSGTGEFVTDPFELARVSNKANEYCKEFKGEVLMEARKAAQPEQTQEQTQSRKHKM